MDSTSTAKYVTPVADLKLGRSDQSVVCRLLRFWDSKNIKKQGEFMGITLLLLDAETAAKSSFHNSAFDSLKLGTNSQTICAHLLRFWKSDKFSSYNHFNGVTLTFVDYKQFMVRTYEQLQMLANTHLELPDVFGCIKSVKSYELNIADVLAPVLLRLQISRDVELEIALLEPVAAVFRRLLNSPNKPQCEMLFTSVNPKRIGGRLCLISTIGTRFYYGQDLSALTHLTGSLVPGQMHDSSLLDVRTTVNTSHIDPIGDLSSFLADTEFKDPLFSCKARTVDLIYPSGWYTVTCVSCDQPLPCSSANQACTQTNANRVVMYQVELLVDDGQHYAVFKVGDKDICGLIKREASSFLAHEVPNANGSILPPILPPALEQLRGGVFVFHVLTATSYNLQSRPFTVVGISELTENEYDPASAPSLVEEGI